MSTTTTTAARRARRVHYSCLEFLINAKFVVSVVIFVSAHRSASARRCDFVLAEEKAMKEEEIILCGTAFNPRQSNFKP